MASLVPRLELGVQPTPGGASNEWPLPNVWLGTSVENQRWADIRIPKLHETPAAVRFLSCEPQPLLGPIDLTTALDRMDYVGDDGRSAIYRDAIGWVIVGGESGHHARPMDPAWVRSIRDQCAGSGVPFFFKQWGGRTPKAGGRELDGRTWDELPVKESWGEAVGTVDRREAADPRGVPAGLR
jgi:protein gp37